MKKRCSSLILATLTLGLWLAAAPAWADTYRVMNQTDTAVTVQCATDSGSSAGGGAVAVEMTVTNQQTVPANTNQDFTCNGALVIQEYGLSAFQCQSGQMQHVTVTTGDNGMHVSETCGSPTGGIS